MTTNHDVYWGRPVWDWEHHDVGTVRGVERDPRTGSIRSLVIEPSDFAKHVLHLPRGAITFSARHVAAIGRDGLVLDRRLADFAPEVEMGGAAA